MSKAELDAIKESCWPRTATPKAKRRSTALFNRSIIPNADGEDEQLINIRHHLTRNMMYHKGMNPSSRPKIPRISQSQDMAEMMKKIDSLVNEHISDVSNLDDLVDLVYSAAVALCEIQGTMPIPEYVNAKSNNAPPWQVRLEGKIVNLKKKLGTYTHI
ncbi:hypothetical protein HHI36_014446 [Cryptolaemus montrouzieri]|uniref:Uncharacterized protein n=1 Tax=Cryptolaemus montrouzieri TaxID=559131 RepID=A0ABD2N3U5_9CUCU